LQHRNSPVVGLLTLFVWAALFILIGVTTASERGMSRWTGAAAGMAASVTLLSGLWVSMIVVIRSQRRRAAGSDLLPIPPGILGRRVWVAWAVFVVALCLTLVLIRRLSLD
jgi:hypothetical protein